MEDYKKKKKSEQKAVLGIKHLPRRTKSRQVDGHKLQDLDQLVYLLGYHSRNIKL